MDLKLENKEISDKELVFQERAFPGIRFIDLRRPKFEKDDFLVANIQIETPSKFFTESKPPSLTPDAEKEQKDKIGRYIKEALEREADLIVLPELSTSRVISNDLYIRIKKTNSILVMGSYYNEYSGNVSPVYIDKDGQINRFEQYKKNPSFEEKSFMNSSSIINVFINTQIGDFAVLICYDATDFSILSALQGYTDLIICPARNRDLLTFNNIFSAITYLQYQYIIFCNDATYGGSAIYLPFHGNRAKDVLGVKNEGIIFRRLNIVELDKMRANPTKHDLFKYPPASVSPRHVPNVDTNKRTVEHFQSKSFNFLIWKEKIIEGFLSSLNQNVFSILIEGASGYRLGALLSNSRQAITVPKLEISRMKLDLIFVKLYLLGKLRSFRKDGLIKRTSDIKEEIQETLLKIAGKQYILFEIDNDKIRDASEYTPELVEELSRIYQIQKSKKLNDVPYNLKVWPKTKSNSKENPKE